MPTKNARRICASALRDWEEGSTYIDAILDRRCKQAGLDARDRAFVHNVTLGVIKNLALLDLWIDGMRKGKLGAEEGRLLELGLYQILLMRVPDHAAVNETVALARPRARGLVNAILRRATRERDELLAKIESQPAVVRYSIPDHIYDRWVEAFGAGRADEIAASGNEPAPLFVRSNPLQGGLTHEDLAAAVATSVSESNSGLSEFYRVESLPIEALDSGRCYAQDPSTASAPRLLDAQPGERVLDACAAPGGKTAIIAAAMENTGKIIAADLSPARADRLASNLERLGVGNARVEIGDLLDTPLPDWAQPASFDRILLDAPCSNTGVFRRRADARWRLAPGFAPQMAKLQSRLANALLPLLKPGGRFVYSTCSIDPEENTAVVAGLMEAHPGLQKLDEIALLPDNHHDGAYATALVRHPPE